MGDSLRYELAITPELVEEAIRVRQLAYSKTYVEFSAPTSIGRDYMVDRFDGSAIHLVGIDEQETTVVSSRIIVNDDTTLPRHLQYLGYVPSDLPPLECLIDAGPLAILPEFQGRGHYPIGVAVTISVVKALGRRYILSSARPSDLLLLAKFGWTFTNFELDVPTLQGLRTKLAYLDVDVKKNTHGISDSFCMALSSAPDPETFRPYILPALAASKLWETARLASTNSS